MHQCYIKGISTNLSIGHNHSTWNKDNLLWDKLQLTGKNPGGMGPGPIPSLGGI